MFTSVVIHRKRRERYEVVSWEAWNRTHRRSHTRIDQLLPPSLFLYFCFPLVAESAALLTAMLVDSH
ncbi:hypothetical protein NZD89_11055 [Alicyclobacillus fastidiosus]|uniref:Uncharacterized protein n=1 Tax=Alicyclobacillus fastidiosus TaxID=392011 RepID=A0ABY6ZP77_9BACL|nr:hypothetical protein [Alicyclobacillus fastidiosus]WAH43871.1 hypothetical protein NZD89_11055 [Alicyclobacillus fastidiosus]GMA60110.1 hypothetical protein GCM10025859_05500 [Alicyclobacillus fastidiosus]